MKIDIILRGAYPIQCKKVRLPKQGIFFTELSKCKVGKWGSKKEKATERESPVAFLNSLLRMASGDQR